MAESWTTALPTAEKVREALESNTLRPTGYIYVISENDNGRQSYVGQAIAAEGESRFLNHYQQAYNYNSTKIYGAEDIIRKVMGSNTYFTILRGDGYYGIDNFIPRFMQFYKTFRPVPSGHINTKDDWTERWLGDISTKNKAKKDYANASAKERLQVAQKIYLQRMMIDFAEIYWVHHYNAIDSDTTNILAGGQASYAYYKSQTPEEILSFSLRSFATFNFFSRTEEWTQVYQNVRSALRVGCAAALARSINDKTQRTVDGSINAGTTAAVNSLQQVMDIGAADINKINTLFANAIYLFLTKREDIDAMIVDAVARNLSFEQRSNRWWATATDSELRFSYSIYEGQKSTNAIVDLIIGPQRDIQNIATVGATVNMFATSKEPKLQQLTKDSVFTEKVKKLSQKLYKTIFPNEGTLTNKKKSSKKKKENTKNNAFNIISFLTKFTYFRKTSDLAEEIERWGDTVCDRNSPGTKILF